jgi:ElaB/YqjD/DUF883 family membrane-anchored ribosome-binding protein
MSIAEDDFAVRDNFDLFCKENKFMTNNPATGTTGDNKQTSGGNGADSQLATTASNLGARAGAAAATATGLAQTAQEYGQKISDVAGQAKDFVGDKVGVVSEKIKELKSMEFSELAENAKEYARQKPGQAILISAAAGLLLGLMLRGRR